MKEYIVDKALDAKATLIFAHGAGAGMSSDFIQRVSYLLRKQHINVIRFNFPYMEQRNVDGKRRPPDRMPKLVDDFEQLIEQIDDDLPLFIGGKSMGSRVAATLLSEKRKAMRSIKGMVAIGYPFHPIGKPENLRVLPLTENDSPTLIVQGDRDKLGNKDEISMYELPTRCQIVYMTDGDHDIKPRVKSGLTQEQHISQACNEIVRFINEQL